MLCLGKGIKPIELKGGRSTVCNVFMCNAKHRQIGSDKGLFTILTGFVLSPYIRMAHEPVTHLTSSYVCISYRLNEPVAGGQICRDNAE